MDVLLIVLIVLLAMWMVSAAMHKNLISSLRAAIREAAAEISAGKSRGI